MRARRYLWIVLAAICLAGVHAQDPVQPTFRTEANYVRVDVYPTLNGAPLTDLQKDDFEIVEDGPPEPTDAIEHVMVTGGLPQELRGEPTSVAESRAMLD